VVRLGDGTPVSHAKMQAAVDELWTYAMEAFIYDEVDQAMVEQRIAPESGVLRESFIQHVSEVLHEATLTMPSPDAYMQRGGKQGRHTERLGYVLAEMQSLQRAYPGVEW
jgi:ring-1,2-phenylacetyl-CoA epoxidase subunit PaaC